MRPSRPISARGWGRGGGARITGLPRGDAMRGRGSARPPPGGLCARCRPCRPQGRAGKMAAGPGSECRAGREAWRGASGGGAGEEKGQENGSRRTERLRRTLPGRANGGAGPMGPEGAGPESGRGGASRGSRGFESRCARALPPRTPALSRRAQAAERRPHRALVHPREALPGLLRHAQRRPELVRERGRRAARAEHRECHPAASVQNKDGV